MIIIELNIDIDAQINKKKSLNLTHYPNNFRFRAVLKRLDGVEKKWMRNSLIMALGGFATKTRFSIKDFDRLNSV